MKIYAKKCTPFEWTIREMLVKAKDGLIAGLKMVDDNVGAMPTDIPFCSEWHTILKLDANFKFTPEDEDKIDKKVLRPTELCEHCWEPNLSTKEGESFCAAFNALSERCKVKEDALHKFGIRMTDFNVRHYIRPFYDKERKQYFLLCSNNVSESFVKEKLATDQFDIIE